MLSAYLDGELTQSDHQRVQLHLETSEEMKRELDELAAVKNMTAGLRFHTPSDDVMDALEQRLSVQAPRKFGWGILAVALIAWVVYAVVLVLRNPRWPTVLELLEGGVIAGLLLVFLSVLRQRILERPHDRYRKVRR
jgi:anti-sigma factor RsiW